MAVEKKRGCGYRKVGGLYLVGRGVEVLCDRLPIPLVPCQVCGAEIRFHRGVARINPQRLWGNHDAPLAVSSARSGDTVCAVVAGGTCWCRRACPACYPGTDGWQMWVGTEYTPASFVQEAHEMGVSKRVARLPKDCRVGDWVYLAHHQAIAPRAEEPLSLFATPSENGGPDSPMPGVFYVFAVTGLEKIVTESQATDVEKMAELRAAGITPVAVPDDDPDHAAQKRRSVHVG